MKAKMLFIESESEFKAKYANRLSRDEYECKLVETAEDACGVLKNQQFDAIVVDLDAQQSYEKIQDNLKCVRSLSVAPLILLGSMSTLEVFITQSESARQTGEKICDIHSYVVKQSQAAELKIVLRELAKKLNGFEHPPKFR